MLFAGKVYKGELQTGNKSEPTIFVAIKTLKENATPKTQSDFKREVDLMTDLRHPNIICLLGVILKGEPMSMLFEYMTQGDLHEFLICHSPRSDVPLNNGNGKILEQPEFLHIALQIASGKYYFFLHKHTKKNTFWRLLSIHKTALYTSSVWTASKSLFMAVIRVSML